MHSDARRLDLKLLAAQQVAVCLEGLTVGSPLPLNSSSNLCYTLELLVPEILPGRHSEWQNESIDVFFFSSTIKSNKTSAALVGTCILISDQAVTPFALDVTLGDSREFRAVRVRLGEPGEGALGISGPKYNSDAARELLVGLKARVALVDWVYDVAL